MSDNIKINFDTAKEELTAITTSIDTFKPFHSDCLKFASDKCKGNNSDFDKKLQKILETIGKRDSEELIKAMEAHNKNMNTAINAIKKMDNYK